MLIKSKEYKYSEYIGRATAKVSYMKSNKKRESDHSMHHKNSIRVLYLGELGRSQVCGYMAVQKA
jgi:hypothetical protein